eukprot:PhF_6_TR4960/c0_g1_i2/m.7029
MFDDLVKWAHSLKLLSASHPTPQVTYLRDLHDPTSSKTLPVRSLNDTFEKTSTDHIRCVAISDTHGLHEYLHIPAADVLLHAGDIVTTGSLFSTKTARKQYE